MTIIVNDEPQRPWKQVTENLYIHHSRISELIEKCHVITQTAYMASG